MTRKQLPFASRRLQRGQAIVLIALMMVLLLGFLGLALDSGRGYVDRRELQNGVDSAALVAGDVYEQTSSGALASQYAIKAYAANERINNLGAPSYFASNPQTYTFPSNPEHKLTIAVAFNNFAGTVFTVTGTHQIPLSIMQVLGLGSTIQVSTTAKAVVGNQNATPALLTLSQGGCGANPGTSMQLQGSSAVVVHGDVYSNGSTVMGGSSAFTIGGNAYTNCGSTPAAIVYDCYSPNPNIQPYPPPCAGTDTVGTGTTGAPVIPDPGYPGGNRAWYNTNYGAPGYENLPGVYTGFSVNGGGGCDWLAPGIYTMQGGFTDHGHQTTNFLKPPDEPIWDNNSVRSPIQFFDTGGCTPNPGFVVTAANAVGGNKLNGIWGVVVTSTRTDYYPPVGAPGATAYGRESAPSMCRTVNLSGGNGGFTVQVFKMPGAQGYNIYTSPNGCNGSFGYTESIAIATGQGTSVTTPLIDKTVAPLAPNGIQCPYTVPATPLFTGCAPPDGESAPFNSPDSTLTTSLNNATAYTQIPLVSTLGLTTVGSSVVLATAPNTTQTLIVAPGSTATTLNVNSFTTSAAYPAGSATVSITNSLANESPKKGLLPGGDRANESQCWPQTTATAAQPCNGAQVTPGAIQFAFPTTNDCLDENGNGGTEIFGGKQYDFITIWFSAANTCSPILNGGSFTQYIGTIYMPAANLTINGGNKAPVAGQVVCYTAYFSGNTGVSISFNPDTAPSPPSARLIF